MPTEDVTKQNYERLTRAYDWFNRHLFDSTLPTCLLTFQRKRTARGYFWRDAVKVRRGKRRTDEIALNPSTFPGRSDQDVMSTLVHEMCHLWQAHFGHPGRRGYHNRQWATKMEEVGLRPSDTGKPGGMKTGERMTHYVIAGGQFEVAWGELFQTGFRLAWEGTPYKPTNRSKFKYTCPGCEVSVWGKPGLNRTLACYPCKLFLVECG